MRHIVNKKNQIMDIRWSEDDDEFTRSCKARFVSKLHPNRLKEFDPCDIEYCLGTLAVQYADCVLHNFNRFLDPLRMHQLENAVRLFAWNWVEPGVYMVMEEACAAFVTLTDWRTERNIQRERYLPHDWKVRREEIESQNEHRHTLMEYLNDRLMYYATENPREIFEWKRQKALTYWSKIKKVVLLRSVGFYWFEISQRQYLSEMILEDYNHLIYSFVDN